MTRASLLWAFLAVACTTADPAPVTEPDTTPEADPVQWIASDAIRRPDLPDDTDAAHDSAVQADTGTLAPVFACDILEPAPGSAFQRGTSIRFLARVGSDAPEDVRLIWSSDAYGPMVLGNDFGFILPAGTHVVKVEGSRSDGAACVDQVTIRVVTPSP